MGVETSKPYPVASKYFPEFEAKLPSLKGKTVAITGTTSGTGFIAARTCVRKGAKNVLLLNRTSERSESAEKKLRQELELLDDCKANIETIACDLQDFASVKEAVASIKTNYDSIDVLANNAGVMALEDVATKDGYDIQMQTNHLSHFLLAKELYSLLTKAAAERGEARVVHHSSMARNCGPLKAEYFGKNGGDLGGNGSSMICNGARWERYHQTKLANATLTLCLQERFDKAGSKVKAVCCAPGLAATNLQVTTNKDGGMGSGMWFMRFAQSAEDGTMPLLNAMFDSTTENGDFYEPNGGGGMWGQVRKVQYGKHATDKDQQEMLWEKSEEACGTFKI